MVAPVGKSKKLDRRIRRKEVMDRYAIGSTTLYESVRLGRFPPPHRLPGGRTVFWWESELLKYERNFKKGLF